MFASPAPPFPTPAKCSGACSHTTKSWLIYDRNGTIQGIKDIIKNLNDAKLDEKTGTHSLGSYLPTSYPGLRHR